MRRLLVLALVLAGGIAGGCTSVRLGPDAAGSPSGRASDEAVSAGERLFPARIGARWGYIDASGAVAIAARFDDAQAFSEGRAGVRVGDVWGLIDPSGAFVAVPAYSAVFPSRAGRARAVTGAGREARMGFLGADGGPVVRPSLTEALDYAAASGEASGEAFAPARAEVARTPFGLDLFARLGLSASGVTPWLVLDARGEVAAEVRAVTVLAFGDAGADAAGRPRLLAPFRAAGAVPGVGGAWGFVDPSGAIAVAPAFRNAAPFSEGRARVSDRERFGFVDGSGAVVIPLSYEQADAFSEGLAAVRSGGLWGYVRPDGSTAIGPRFEAARGFTGGLAAVREGGLWGFVRPDGSVAVAPRFEEAAPFRGALARVVENGQAAYIDASGAVVWRGRP